MNIYREDIIDIELESGTVTREKNIGEMFLLEIIDRKIKDTKV